MANIFSINKEKRKFKVSKDFSEKAHIKSEKEYNNLYSQSINEPEKFWEKVASELSWEKKYTKVFEWENFKQKKFVWFKNGKINGCYNCLDRHLKDKANQIALIWQGEQEEEVRTFTYQQLHKEVCRFSNVLKKKNLKKGDRVAIYLPMIPELLISMLACARLGIMHTVVFAGFSIDALLDRIKASEAKMLITSDGGYRNGKTLFFKQNIDEVFENNLSFLKSIIIVNRINDKNLKLKDIESYWNEEMLSSDISDSCDYEVMDSNEPLFLLYTSGTTGKPKGIVHSTGGYLTYVYYTFKTIFDYKPKEVFWCTADIGWITGHSYLVYAPLLNGATTLMFESVPTYPEPNRFWKIVDKFKVNIFYTAPTVIRSLQKFGEEYPNSCDLSSLRVLGSVGEPINSEAWLWYYKNIGKEKCPIVDTWWQTESGGFLISPFPGAHTMKPSSANKPFFGVIPEILRDDGSKANIDEGGNLVIKQPWPGMMQTVFKDHERYLKTYWNVIKDVYFSGDGAKVDEDGDFFLLGRIDDVINVSGHRLGTAEIEATIALDNRVSEAAVVPFPHEIKGQAIYAFVVLKDNVNGSQELIDELRKYVAKKVGPIAKPDKIQFVSALPKTRSGKIMRRILKAIGEGKEDVGNITTLINPEIVEKIKKERV